MRNIFIVSAFVVDSNGTFSSVNGYPKTFDSKNYSDNVDTAKKRAEGDLSEQWGAMCKRDDRQIQTAMLSDVFGNVLEKKSMGNFPTVEPEQA